MPRKISTLIFTAILPLLLLLLCSVTAFAQISVTVPAPTKASWVTVNVQSTSTTTGYVTLLTGTGKSCGSNAQVQAGLDSTGAAAFAAYVNIPLTATDTYPLATDSNGTYLTPGAAYMVCFSALAGGGSQPKSANFTALKLSSSTAVTPNNNPALYEQAIIFTATVSPVTTGEPAGYTTPPTPTGGIVTFKDGATTLGTGTLSNGTATFNTATLPLAFSIGNHSITAEYAGGSSYTASNSVPLNQSVQSPADVGIAIENTGANMTTLVVQAASAGLGYFTLVNGSEANCGTGTQVMAGQTSASVTAPYHGSLPLTANTPGRYTIRNLPENTVYTACFISGQNLARTPVKTTVATTPSLALTNPAWDDIGGVIPDTDGGHFYLINFAPDGTPYVARGSVYERGLLSDILFKYNGTAWVSVGGNGLPYDYFNNLSLTFAPDGTPYISFRATNSTSKATVMKFDGTSWVYVGNPGFSAGPISHSSLAFAPDGSPHLSYKDDGNGGKATAMKFNGTSWVNVGPAGFSAGAAAFTSLAFAPDGTPYVAYQDSSTTPAGKATVMKFTGGSWTVVGSAGFSANPAEETSLAIAPDGSMYVAYREGGSPKIMKLIGATWTALATAGLTSSCDFPVVAVSPNGTPYITYQDYVGAITAKVLKYNGFSWITISSRSIASSSPNGAISLAFAADGVPYVAYNEATDNATYSSGKVYKLKNGTTTAVASNINPADWGQTVTYTATVTPAAATGTVTFYNGTNAVGTAPLASGVATFNTKFAVAGSYDITAVYSGDNSYADSTSSVLTQVVNKTASATTLISAINPATIGVSLQFTATVTAATVTETPTTPTGTVTFLDGADVIGSAPLSGGSASFSTAALALGGHSITAVYAGNGAYTGSTSAALIQNVQIPAVSIATENAGANMITLLLQSSGSGNGYFTLHNGSGVTCGSGTQVKAGQTAAGATALQHGSLPLTAGIAGRYTLRNLTESSAYTVCFTADSPVGQNLQTVPATANLSTVAATAVTNPAWGVTDSGISTGAATYTSVAFTPDGTQYVAYQEGATGNKATLKKRSGTGWLAQGTDSMSWLNPDSLYGYSDFLSLAFAPDNTPYVAYKDSYTGNKATIGRFDGGMFTAVGVPYPQGVSAGVVDYTSLAMAPDGSPTVAYKDAAYSGKATVLTYNGTSWVTVGSPGFTSGTADYTSLAFGRDGFPYLAYKDGDNGGKLTVKRYDGANWVNAGTPGQSTSAADYIALAMAPDGTPHVTYKDGGNGGKATVLKYTGVTNWVPVGGAGFSAGTADYTSLAFAPDGAPHVIYRDAANGSKATVMKFSGSSWAAVGTGFTSGTAAYTSLAFAPDGILHVFFADGSNASRATAMYLKNGSSVELTADIYTSTGHQPVKFTAKVTPATASGSITFKDGGTVLGTTVLTGGTAELITSDLIGGSHSIVASYSGDAIYSAAVSPLISLAVNRNSSAVALSSNTRHTSYSEPVTFTATLTPSQASGAVTFKEGATTLGSAMIAGDGKATFRYTGLSSGSHTVLAVYAGDNYYNGSSSGTVAQLVTPFSLPVLTTPAVEMIFAGMATVRLQSSDSGTGYFTILPGHDTPCGTAVQIKAGQSANGTPAKMGSLPLMDGAGPQRSTIRNLAANSPYTVCFTATADVAGGQYLQEIPLYANFTTPPAPSLTTPEWEARRPDMPNNAGIGQLQAFAPDGSMYVAFLENVDSSVIPSTPVFGLQKILRFSNGAWSELVSIPGTNNSDQIQLIKSMVVAPDGTLYVAFNRRDAKSSKIMKYRDGLWQQVPDSADGACNSLQIAVATDNILHAFCLVHSDPLDVASPFVLKVMKRINDSWVSSPAVPPVYPEQAYRNSTAYALAPDNIPYMLSSNANLGGHEYGLSRFNGVAWDTVATYTTDAVNPAYENKGIVFAPDGRLYVSLPAGFPDGINPSLPPVVMYYDGAGLVALDTGLPPLPIGTEYYNPLGTSLVIAPDGTLYLGYSIKTGLQTPYHTMKYKDGVWSQIGKSIATGVEHRFSAPYLNYSPLSSPSLTVAPDGTLWLPSGLSRYSSTIYPPGNYTPGSLLMLKNSVAPLLTLDPALSSMDYGQAVTVTATLPADADGTIDFMDGSTVLATLPLVNGSASYSLAQLGVAPSAHSISAVYSGNAQHYTASTSESVLLTVTKATVGIQLTSTPNPSTLDDNVTFTAAMTPAATSGTITFKDGETVLRSVPITNGIASFNYFALAAGMHTISATYDGNANTGTASAALQHTVGLDLHQLQTTVNGSGSVHGSAWSLTVGSPSDIACTDNSGTCSALYPAWDVVDLMATGGAASLFDSWSGDCAGKISSCSVIVDGSKPVTSVGANFIPAPLAKNSTKDVAYPTLSAALSAANSVTTDDLLLLGIGYDGAVTLSKGINFKGGWNPLYLNLTGVWTILNNGLTVESGDSSLETIGVIGKLTVKGGKVTAKGVKVK